VFYNIFFILLLVCFKVFDTDRDGVLNFVEIKQMVNILTFVAKESSNSNIYKNIIADDIIVELYNRSTKKELESSSEVRYLILK